MTTVGPRSGGKPIEAKWSLASTEAGAVASPDQLAANLDWIEAAVPGTVAAALSAAGKWSLDKPQPLHRLDHWYRCTFDGEGATRLVFEGLATVAEIWLNGERIIVSRNMFAPSRADVVLRGRNALCICFRSLDAALSKTPSRPRPRWRTRLVSEQRLRWIRSSLIGHMPGWCPQVHAIGPWRPITIVHHDRQYVVEHRANARLEGKRGMIDVRVRLARSCSEKPVALCEGRSHPLSEVEPGVWSGRLEIPDAELWWPHTHGTPRLYPLTLRCDGEQFDLGQAGFRTVTIDKGADGSEFRLVVNGVPVFCRGAVWTSSDIVGLSGEEATYRPALEALRDANLNMVRVPGTMVYEASAFHDLCDELGILVWQDFMFANFDYPDGDETFRAEAAREAEAFLGRVQSSPSLAVLCGGSEVHQQATMLGYPLKATASRIFDETLPDAVARLRPDVPYITNSPFGGALPFSVSSGPAHYFGVGAYLRPLDDARRANVKFASECLAFANIPEPATLERALPVAPFHHPKWKERTPRDQGASWDFEDVRDHYLEQLYRVDARRLRIVDPERYLSASRAVVADVFEATFAEWRRTGSPTAGALVLTHQDLWPGAGWGIVDSLGEPKSPWYAMRRACAPVTVFVTDEGLDGLLCHVVNDSAVDLGLELGLRCLRDGSVPVIDATMAVAIPARGRRAISSSEIIGQFFDITSAYNFGPASHDVTIARLSDPHDGRVIAEAFHLTKGDISARAAHPLKAGIERDGADWFLTVTSPSFARRVTIDDRKFRPEDNYFHLDPAAPRRIRLVARNAADAEKEPAGEITALDRSGIVRYGGGR